MYDLYGEDGLKNGVPPTEESSSASGGGGASSNPFGGQGGSNPFSGFKSASGGGGGGAGYTYSGKSALVFYYHVQMCAQYEIAFATSHVLT